MSVRVVHDTSNDQCCNFLALPAANCSANGFVGILQFAVIQS